MDMVGGRGWEGVKDGRKWDLTPYRYYPCTVLYGTTQKIEGGL